MAGRFQALVAHYVATAFGRSNFLVLKLLAANLANKFLFIFQYVEFDKLFYGNVVMLVPWAHNFERGLLNRLALFLRALFLVRRLRNLHPEVFFGQLFFGCLQELLGVVLDDLLAGQFFRFFDLLLKQLEHHLLPCGGIELSLHFFKCMQSLLLLFDIL